MKVLRIISTCVLLLAHCFANQEVIEFGRVQIATSLSGTVTDPTGAPIPGVQVIEVTIDWHTTLRKTITDADGRWSLAPTDKKVYYIRLVKGHGFNEVRFRVRLDKRKGKELLVKLPLA